MNSRPNFLAKARTGYPGIDDNSNLIHYQLELQDRGRRTG
jgi:hypothetical protein